MYDGRTRGTAILHVACCELDGTTSSSTTGGIHWEELPKYRRRCPIRRRGRLACGGPQRPGQNAFHASHQIGKPPTSLHGKICPFLNRGCSASRRHTVNGSKSSRLFCVDEGLRRPVESPRTRPWQESGSSSRLSSILAWRM